MKKILPFLFSITLILCKTNFVFAQIDINDSLALVNLYDSTGGPGWYYQTNWLTPAPVTSWFGVTVNNNRVSRLILEWNGLTGNIPSSVGTIANLSMLDLWHNNLTGSIPASIGQLSNLSSLNLSENLLTGNIPDSIGNMIHLSALDLSRNNLTGNIPSSVGNLASLTDILLSGNHLTGKLPSTVVNMPQLQLLGVADNQLTGQLPSFKSSPSLRQLFLSNNFFTGTIPPALVNSHPQLLDLDLAGNQLTGQIPSFVNCPNLQNLFLSGNDFSSGPMPRLPSTNNLVLLNLSGCNLTDTLPSSLGEHTYLQNLILNFNQFTGEIPASIGNLYAAVIALDHNNLSGKVPESLSALTVCIHPTNGIFIHDNYFTFSGIEYIDSITNCENQEFKYSPQANIPITYNQPTSMLSVSAGGTLKNNTYKWYRNGSLYKTIVGNSTFIVDSAGIYHVEVTNYFATQLTLVSDTVSASPATVSVLKNISVTEGNTSYTAAKFKIVLNHSSSSTVKINYTTKDGTATGGSDYLATAGTVTIKPGNVSKTLTVNVIGDNTYESNEKFSLVLSNPVNALLGSLDSATCTIKNDDPLSPQRQTNNNTAIAEARVKLYPNPVRDELTIEGLTGTTTLSVLDMQARQLITTAASNGTKAVNVKQLSPGVYYLRIQSDDKIITLKFVKQ